MPAIDDFSFRALAEAQALCRSARRALVEWRAHRAAAAIARRQRHKRRLEARKKQQFVGVLISSSVGIATSKTGRRH